MNAGTSNKRVWAVVFSLVVLALAAAPARGDSFSNVTKLSQVITGDAQDVAVSGNYAYVAAAAVFTVIDISNPAAPNQVGLYDITGNANGVFVSGNYAYVAAGSAGLRVIDVTVPSNPTEVGFYDTAGTANDLVVSGNYAYVADDTNGLVIINISNPLAPTLTGSYNTIGTANRVFVPGSYAYVADGTNGLVILDVSNPAAPALTGSYNTAGTAYGVAVSGSYAYVADASNVVVIDVSVPSAPAQVASVGVNYSYDITISGNYAYVADFNWFRVLDISNPLAPTSIATIQTTSKGLSWAVFQSGIYAYCAEHTGGLIIFNVSNPAAPSITGQYDLPGSSQNLDTVGDKIYLMDDMGMFIYDMANPMSPSLLRYMGLSYGDIDISVSGNYAYMAYLVYFNIYNISNPASISQTASIYPVNSSKDVHKLGNYAYEAEGSFGLRILDVSNPSAPFTTAMFDTTGNALGVRASGTYAYVADGNMGLRVIDVSNPGAPFEAGAYDTTGNANGVFLLNNYALVADGASGLQIIDVSNPAAPTLLGTYNTPGTAMNVYAAGNYAFVADGTSGLRVINISNPAAPTESGFYQTYGDARDVSVSGDRIVVADYGAGMFIFDFLLDEYTAPYVFNTGSVVDSTWRAAGGTTYDVDFVDIGGSLLNSVQYSVWTGTNQSGTQLIPWTNIATSINSGSYLTNWAVNFAALQEGTNYVYARGTDNAANTTTVTTHTFYIKKDTVTPATTDNWTDNWTNSATVTVTISPTDATSGVASTVYCTDSANSCAPGTAGVSAAVTCTAGTVCTQYVRYKSTDNAGNIETVSSKRVRQDLQSPTFTTIDGVNAAWNTSDTIAVSVSDASGAGASSTTYWGYSADATCNASDDAALTNTGAMATVSTNHVNDYVCFRNTDLAGNKGYSTAYGPLKVDLLAPTFTVTDGANPAWNNSDTITVTVADAASGASATTYWGYSADATCDASDDANLTNTGLTTIVASKHTDYVCFRNTDAVGNTGYSTAIGPLKVDVVAPAFTITDGANPAWNSSDTITVTVADSGGSGASSTTYWGYSADATCDATDDANLTNTGVTTTVASNHTDYVCFRNTDNAGNKGYSTAIGPLYVDVTLPVISGTVTPANTDYGGAYVDGAYDLSVGSISDALSGTASCDYTVNNGGAWTNVPGYVAAGATCSVTGIACTNGTALTLNFRITDNAGNQQTGTAVTRTCDTVAPTTTFVGPASGTWEKADFTVDVTNADNLSGLATCYYRVLSNAVQTLAWTSYTCATDPTITVGVGMNCRDEGSNICQVEFYNVDNVGNTATAVARQFSIDWTSPVIAGTVTPANTDSGTHVDGTYDLSVGTISDATSNTASCDYTVNGGTSWTSVPGYTPGGATCSVTGITCTDGTALTLNFRITDNAGNQQTGTQVARTCDTVAPTTAFVAPAASAWATTTFTVDVTNADTASGLATCSYRVLSNGVQTLGWTSYTCANDQSVTVGAAANCLDEGADKCSVEFYNVDNVGNTATAVSRAFSIDFTNPATAINAPATSTWEKASFIVDVTNADAISGLSTCYYRVLSNGVQTLGWTSYTCANDQTVTVGAASNCRDEGADKCLVEFYNTDVAGNTASVVSRTFSIDYTNPVIAGVVTPANTDSGTHVDGTYDLSAGTISDATSNTASCDYTVNGGTSWTSVPGYTPGGATCSVTGLTCTDGTALTLNIRITDNAGNQQTGTLISRTCDTAAPTTVINAPAASSWQRLNFTADVTNADSRAGLSACYYRVVSNSVQTLAWTSYTCANDPTITVGPGMDCRDENPNICTVEFYAVDNVTNTETAVSRTFSINWTGPMLQGVITPANNDSGTRVDRTFDLSASFTDPDGIASCEYCKSTDGACDTEWTAGTWNNTTSKCSVTNLTCTDGQTLTLDMRATDIPANTGVGSAVTRLCDDTPPAVAISQPATGYKTNNPSLAVSGTTEAGATVSVNGTAATVTAASYTATITLSEGANTVTSTAADAVANAASTSITVYLDTIPPTASVSSPAAAQNVTGDVAITGVATDANFLEYAVYYGPGTSPTAWGVAVASTTASVSSGTLGTWSASNLYGTYTVRLAVKDMMENITEVRRQVFVYNEERFTATIPADVWSMISLPGIPQNGDPAAFLGTGRYEMQRWVASLTPDADGLKYTISFSVTAGDGFWVKPYKVPISYDFKAWVLDTTADFEKHLLAGWNQVGVPFNRTALWSNFEYKRDGDAAAVPLVTAVSNGWLDSKIYSYSNGGFVANDAASTMQPFTGYFIYAKATGTLILDPGAGQTGGVARTVRPAYLWRLRLAAETASARDTENFIGEQSGAQAGSLVEGSPEPPAVEPYVSLYIPSAEKLAADIRAPKNTQETGNEWAFTVDTGGSEQVTLTWPDISGVPENYVLIIRDTAAGLDIDPRVTSSYAFTTGSDGKRSFTAAVRNTQPPVLAEEREFSSAFQPGWTLFTVPLETAQTDVRALLGQDTAGLAIYQHYDNSLNGPGSPGGVDIQPGAAYWAYASAPAEVTFRGGAVADGAPLDVPLAPGWNLIGSPFTDEFPVDNIRVVKDGLELTLQDAAAEGWLDGLIYGYAEQSGGWMPIQPGGGLMPGDGYAIKAKAGCTLRFKS